VTIAQERGKSRQLPDVTQDGVTIPGPYVLPVDSNECIALIVRKSEPGRLKCRNEIDLPRAGINVGGTAQGQFSRAAAGAGPEERHHR
jgi:hypothetical protein